MKKFSFKKIDAFTNGASSGNPAAGIYPSSEDDISDTEMLAIARELKNYANEVGYLFPGSDTDFRLRYFSSEREVDFCGHATIAIMYDMINSDPLFSSQKEITIRTNKGISTVFNKTGTGEGVFISAPEPEFYEKSIDPLAVSEALEISPEQLHKTLPIEIVNGGLQTLVIPMADLESTVEIIPHFEKLKELCENLGIDIITIFSEETSLDNTSFRSRVFPPTFGYAEDPATGSGSAALCYYLQKNAIWNGEPVSIEQNSSLNCPNIIQISLSGERVLFGGKAIKRIDGTYFI